MINSQDSEIKKRKVKNLKIEFAAVRNAKRARKTDGFTYLQAITQVFATNLRHESQNFADMKRLTLIIYVTFYQNKRTFTCIWLHVFTLPLFARLNDKLDVERFALAKRKKNQFAITHTNAT